MKKLLILLLTLVIILGGCKPQEPEIVESKIDKNSPKAEVVAYNKEIDESLINLIQFSQVEENVVKATIKTSKGDIEVVLFPDQAPVAVEAFITNAEAGIYKNSSFDKIIENFYIETSSKSGGYSKPAETSDEKDKETETETEVGVETNTNLWHFRGALSMRDNLVDSPNSNLSQFFIVQAKLLPDEIFTEMSESGFPQKVIDKYKEVGGIPGYDTNYTVFGQVTEGLDILDEIAYSRVTSDYAPENPVVIEDIVVDTSSYKK